MAKSKLQRAHRDYRQEQTDALISAIESGTAPWQRPFLPGTERRRPFNFISGKAYRGGNALLLSIASQIEFGGDPRWMTFNQASERGMRIKPGSKGNIVEYWQFEKIEEVIGENGEKKREYVKLDTPFVRRSVVFNGQQIEGMPELAPVPKSEIEQVEMAERILSASGAVIKFDSPGKAFYLPLLDEIHSAPRDTYRSTEDYYSTLLHELGHWTGHADRLDREAYSAALRGSVPKDVYAKEELRAEIASYFLAMDTGISVTEEHLQNHAAYVASWLEVLKKDKNEIYRAAKDAEQICGYLTRGLELGRDTKIPEVPESGIAVGGKDVSMEKDGDRKLKIAGSGTMTEVKPRLIEFSRPLFLHGLCELNSSLTSSYMDMRHTNLMLERKISPREISAAAKSYEKWERLGIDEKRAHHDEYLDQRQRWDDVFISSYLQDAGNRTMIPSDYPVEEYCKKLEKEILEYKEYLERCHLAEGLPHGRPRHSVEIEIAQGRIVKIHPAHEITTAMVEANVARYIDGEAKLANILRSGDEIKIQKFLPIYRSPSMRSGWDEILLSAAFDPVLRDKIPSSYNAQELMSKVIEGLKDAAGQENNKEIQENAKEVLLNIYEWEKKIQELEIEKTNSDPYSMEAGNGGIKMTENMSSGEYERKTIDVVSPGGFLNRGFDGTKSKVVAGWIKGEVNEYRDVKNGVFRIDFTAALKAPGADGNFPDKTPFILVSHSSTEPIDLSQFKDGKAPLMLVGQQFLISPRDAGGRVKGERRPVLLVRAMHEVIPGEKHPGRVVSSADGAVKNEFERASKEMLTGYVYDNERNVFNKPLEFDNPETGKRETFGYAQRFSVNYQVYKDGKPVIGEDGKTVWDWMRVDTVTKEKIDTSMVLSKEGQKKKLSLQGAFRVFDYQTKEKEWVNNSVSMELSKMSVYREKAKRLGVDTQELKVIKAVDPVTPVKSKRRSKGLGL